MFAQEGCKYLSQYKNQKSILTYEYKGRSFQVFFNDWKFYHSRPHLTYFTEELDRELHSKTIIIFVFQQFLYSIHIITKMEAFAKYSSKWLRTYGSAMYDMFAEIFDKVIAGDEDVIFAVGPFVRNE